jgi:hypothetical protein
MVRRSRVARVPPGWGSRNRRFSKGSGLSLRLWLCPALEVNGVVEPEDALSIDKYLSGVRSRRSIHGLHGDLHLPDVAQAS